MTNTFALPLAQGPAQGSSPARQAGGAARGLAGLLGSGRSGQSPAGAGALEDSGHGPSSFQAALAARQMAGGDRYGVAPEAGSVPPGDEGSAGDPTPDPSATAAAVAGAGLLVAASRDIQPEAVVHGEEGAPAGSRVEVRTIPGEAGHSLPGLQEPVIHGAWGDGTGAAAAPITGEEENPALPPGLFQDGQILPAGSLQESVDTTPEAVSATVQEAPGVEVGMPVPSGALPEIPDQESHAPVAGHDPAMAIPLSEESQALPGGDAPAPAPPAVTADKGAPVDGPPPAAVPASPEAAPGLGPEGVSDDSEAPLVDQGSPAGGPAVSTKDGFRFHHAVDRRGLRVAFAPEGLGSIEIAVREERLGLGLRLHAAQVETTRLLAAGLDDLVAALRQRQSGAVSVSVRHSGDDGALDTGYGHKGGAFPDDGRSAGSFHREFRSGPREREHPWPRAAGTPAAAPAARAPARAGRSRPGMSTGGRLNRWV